MWSHKGLTFEHISYKGLTTLKWRIQALLFYFSPIFAVLLISLQEHDTWELLQFARSILLTSFTLALRHSNNASLCLFVWLFVCFFSITRFFNKDAQVWQVHEGILLSLTERDPLVSNASISDKMHFLSWGYSTNFHTGRLRPKVQPLTLLYTIFHEKGTPFVYFLLTNGTPSTYLVYNFVSLLTGALKDINHTNGTFSRLYKAITFIC